MTPAEAAILFEMAGKERYLIDDPLDVEFATRKEQKAFAKGVVAGLLLSADEARCAAFLIEHSTAGDTQ